MTKIYLILMITNKSPLKQRLHSLAPIQLGCSRLLRIYLDLILILVKYI